MVFITRRVCKHPLVHNESRYFFAICGDHDDNDHGTSLHGVTFLGPTAPTRGLDDPDGGH